jgi:Fasciclin domain
VPPEILALLEDPELSVTLLLPPEDDLAQLSALVNAGTLDTIDAFNILGRHFITDVYSSADLLATGSGEVATLNEDDVLFMVTGDAITFTLKNISAEVIEADLPSCAGDSVIHKIDLVMHKILIQGTSIILLPICPHRPSSIARNRDTSRRAGGRPTQG